MNIRKHAFWILDYLRGSKIGRHYQDISAILEGNTSFLTEKSIEYRSKIFAHAKSKVPYYQQMNGVADFEELPVVNKSVIKNNFEQFRSIDYAKAKLHQMSTSGSTGSPFMVYQDLSKRRRVLAEILYFNRLLGFEVGHHLVFYRALTENSRKSWLMQRIQNESLIDTSHLGDASLSALEKQIQRFPRHSLLCGYASSLETIGRYIHQSIPRNEWKRYTISSVITGAEALSDSGRKNLETVFQCPVVSRYSNQEMGILGQQIANDNVFMLNHSSYYFEIFDMEKDVPVHFGLPGRIVVTDMFNHAMPMLRYDTGDTGVIEKRDIHGVSTCVLTSLEGRKIDYICDPQGKLLSPHCISKAMWNFQEVIQFQFIQKSARDYLVRLNMGGTFFEKEKKLIDCFQEVLGDDAIITVEYVDEIPVLASGKRRYIINEYSPSLS